MTVDALKRLAEELEAGTKYETMGHTMLCQKAFPKPDDFDGSREAYANSNAQKAILAWRNGSLDAAKALHDAVLTEWRYELNNSKYHDKVALVRGGNGIETGYCYAENCHARAWLLAILKALIAQEESK